MKTPKQSGKLVAQVRKIIGKSQSQFATMIGGSKHTVISVENGRNQVSKKLARRIQIATGVNWLKSADGKLLDIERNEYTYKSFESWRTRFNNADSAMRNFKEVKFWLEIFFRAAAKPGVAGNRDRLPAVYMSLVDWLYNTAKTFKLDQEIDDILEALPHEILHRAYSYGELKTNDFFLANIARQHGMTVQSLKDQIKKHKHRMKRGDVLFLNADMESRRVWLKENEGHLSGIDYSQTQQLLTKPKFEFQIISRANQP